MSAPKVVTAAPSRAPVRVRVGRFLFRYRNGVFPAILIVLLVFAEPVLFGRDLASDLVLDGIGFAIATAGQGLRGVVNGLAYVKRGGQKRQIAASKLVRYGVFSVSRNPLYVGNIAIIMGLVVIYNSPWGYALVLPAFCFAYLCIVEAEEDYLRSKFGVPYEKYCAEVSRFIPVPWKWKWVREEREFDFRRMLRSDYSSAFYWFTLALIMMALEGIRHAGWDASMPRTQILGAIWAVGLVAWILVRMLKVKKLLATPD